MNRVTGLGEQDHQGGRAAALDAAAQRAPGRDGRERRDDHEGAQGVREGALRAEPPAEAQGGAKPRNPRHFDTIDASCDLLAFRCSLVIGSH